MVVGLRFSYLIVSIGALAVYAALHPNYAPYHRLVSQTYLETQGRSDRQLAAVRAKEQAERDEQRRRADEAERQRKAQEAEQEQERQRRAKDADARAEQLAQSNRAEGLRKEFAALQRTLPATRDVLGKEALAGLQTTLSLIRAEPAGNHLQDGLTAADLLAKKPCGTVGSGFQQWLKGEDAIKSYQFLCVWGYAKDHNARSEHYVIAAWSILNPYMSEFAPRAEWPGNLVLRYLEALWLDRITDRKGRYYRSALGDVRFDQLALLFQSELPGDFAAYIVNRFGESMAKATIERVVPKVNGYARTVQRMHEIETEYAGLSGVPPLFR